MFLCNKTCKQQNLQLISVKIWYLLITSVLHVVNTKDDGGFQIVILLTLEKEYLNAHNISRPIMRNKNELQDKYGSYSIIKP